MALFFEEARVKPRENDPTDRKTDSAVACCEPPAEAETAGDEPGEPIVAEADDREEAGYGYGV
jgi:hypothetical protein